MVTVEDQLLCMADGVREPAPHLDPESFIVLYAGPPVGLGQARASTDGLAGGESTT